MKRHLKSLIITSLLMLASTKGAFAFEESYTVPVDSTAQDKWFGTYYTREGKNNDVLKVGGWGDGYYSLIKMPAHFNVPPRILLNSAKLNLYSYGSSRPTSMRKWFVTTTWSESSTTDHWSVHLSDQGTIPAPPENGWYSFDITAEYYAWITSQYQNYGLALTPENTDNRFNTFFSTDNNRNYGKPYIVVNYERLPDLKLPLPGGVAWKLTVEAGGKQFDEQTTLDTFHTGVTYYSLDFSPTWIPLSGGTSTVATDVPIYAAAGGKIVASESNAYNGWYVKIDHDNDGNLGTGFQTAYLHLKNQPLVGVGNHVKQGQQIGIMGNTGQSLGTHLHMTFYFKNTGGISLSDYDSAQLNALRMEGRAIKNYKVGTTWNGSLWTPIIYYPSSNTVP